jgi:hypothetical protein
LQLTPPRAAPGEVVRRVSLASARNLFRARRQA